MTQPGFSTRGVVDLGAFRPAPAAPAGSSGAVAGGNGAAPAQAGAYVVDVTEADFQALVIDASTTAPVVLDFWAAWCGPCKQLSPVLERLAAAYEGRWLLAKIDVDANPRLAGAFGVQGIPSVFAVVGGQPVPLFTGALPEAQVRQYLDELLRVAEANGVAGRVAAGDAPGGQEGDGVLEGPAAALPPGVEEALQALDRGDLDGAAEAYRRVLQDAPAEEAARVGLAQVELLRRMRGRDLRAVRQAAADRPDDVPAQLEAADADLLGGHVADGFARLVDVVRRTSGAERERVREHLLELFEVVGGDDPRVLQARRDLASALF